MRWPGCAAKGLAWHWSGSGVQRDVLCPARPCPLILGEPCGCGRGGGGHVDPGRGLSVYGGAAVLLQLFLRGGRAQGQQHSGVRRAAGRAAGFLFTLPLLWGLEGVWIAYPAAVAVMAAAALWLLRRRHLALRPQAGGEGAA